MKLKFFSLVLFSILPGVSAFADLGLYVYPLQTLINKPVSIRVTGIKPGSSVTLDANMTDEKGRQWHSTADFVANSAGVVSPAEQSPLKGSYLTDDAMGLFWSMQLAADTKDKTSFSHRSLDPMIVELTATSRDQHMEVKITRQVVASGVSKIPIPSETGLVGNLFLPESKGLLPTVIVLGGSDGGLPSDAYVAQFANQGYAAVGLAYFKAPGLPTHAANIPLEYFGKTIQWLQNQPGLNTRKLSLIGTSLGGMAALEVAAHYPEIKSVVAFDGSGVVFEAFDRDPQGFGEQSIFSYQGKPLAYISLKKSGNDLLRGFLEGWLNADATTQDKATIPVENIQGPILLLAGTNDTVAASTFFSAQAYERLSEKHFPYFYRLINYNGVGHSLGVDGLSYTPSTILADLGGNPKDTADAQVASWQAVFEFLEKYAR